MADSTRHPGNGGKRNNGKNGKSSADMKVVILAGGFGTRISEESGVRPKPMVEIGGKPILWHIMKIYSYYGFHDFIICLGYRGDLIKDYFAGYYLHNSDVTLNMNENRMIVHKEYSEPWNVTLIDTGEGSMTGGRIKRVRSYIGNRTFLMTYGDGVSDIDIPKTIEHHKARNALVTLTAVQQPGRFGAFMLEEGDDRIDTFHEKPKGDGRSNAFISGGFFVVEPEAVDYIADDSTVWEREPLETFAKEGRLSAYRHPGFWQPMDTLRDRNVLEQLWSEGRAPWCLWDLKRASA